MAYKITITEEVDVEKMVQPEYQIIGEQEVERDRCYFEHDKNEPKTRIEKLYGHPPPVKTTVHITRQVLTQEVENLDLVAVIKAVNGIAP